MGYRVYVRSKKTKPASEGGGLGHWPEKKRLECVTTYLSVGSLQLTSALTNVPRDTLKTWQKQDWWKEAIRDLQEQDTVKLDAKLEKILDKSLEYVGDRIENGDPMYDPRTGKVVRIPARLRDLHKVSTDLIDKRLALRKRNDPAEGHKQQVTADHLVQLAQAFAEMATGKKKEDRPAEIIEGECTEHFDQLGREEGYKEKE